MDSMRSWTTISSLLMGRSVKKLGQLKSLPSSIGLCSGDVIKLGEWL